MGKPAKIYVNMTNGLEFFERNPQIDANDVVFMRVQSTHCEQKQWELVFASIPDDMLMRLALGYKVIVVDYGKRHQMPRALWQGMELLKYVLYRMWFDREYMPQTRAVSDNGEYFANVYLRLRDNRRIRRRIEYFKRFLQTDDLDIEYVYDTSRIDTHWDKILDITAKLAGNGKDAGTGS